MPHLALLSRVLLKSKFTADLLSEDIRDTYSLVNVLMQHLAVI